MCLSTYSKMRRLNHHIYVRYLQEGCLAGQAVTFANHGTKDVIVLGPLAIQ